MFIIKTKDDRYLELRESGKAEWSSAPRRCVTFVTESSFLTFMRDNFSAIHGTFQMIEDGRISKEITI